MLKGKVGKISIGVCTKLNKLISELIKGSCSDSSIFECYLILQRLCRCDVVKVLELGIYPGGLGGPKCSHRREAERI